MHKEKTLWFGVKEWRHFKKIVKCAGNYKFWKRQKNQEFQGTFRNGVKYLYGKSIERYDTISTLTRNDIYPVGNIKADKEKSAEKIDGAIATIIGIDCTIYCGNDTDASVYNGRIIYLFY